MLIPKCSNSNVIDIQKLFDEIYIIFLIFLFYRKGTREKKLQIDSVMKGRIKI
jgi:hypothetical protein